MNLEEKDIFVAVQWPESQELLELPDFNDNAILINGEGLYEEYGPSSYMVRKIWLDSIHSKKKMNNPSQKSNEAHEKFLAFLVASMGADITAPDGVFNQEMESFKEIRNVEDDDEAVDALVAVARTESQQGRLEIVQILCMRLFTLNNCSKLAAFLREYTHHMLDYLNEHPEHRDQNPQDKALDAIKGMFGGDDL